MAAPKKPKQTYSSLLSLSQEVQKKPKPNKPKPDTIFHKPAGNRGRSRSRSPRPNKKVKSLNWKVPKGEEMFINWDIPDRQYGDLYCKPCDSHMNSEQMWEAHISGKRHLKSVKKGDLGDQRYVYVDEEPIMTPQLEADTRPIVGLHHLVEIQRLEQPPLYQCFLCSSSVPNPKQLLEHLAGVKHRLAYLKEHDNERYTLIQHANLKKGHVEPVVEECIAKHESTEGRGKMLVKQELYTESSPPRNYNKDNQEEYPRNPRNQGNKEDDRVPRRYRTNVNEDMDSNQNSSRHDDFDRGRQYDDRRYDGPPEDHYSNREPNRDREAAYYKRSPERSDGYKRPVRPDPYERDIPPPDRMDKSRMEEERYAYSNPPQRERYDSFGPSDDPRFSKDDKHVDLREVLEKKKTDPYYNSDQMEEYRKNEIVKAAMDLYRKESMGSTFGTSSMHTASNNGNTSSSVGLGKSSTLASMTGNIPDAYLELVEAMSPTVFLQLALFKINRIGISTELELKLLDKLSSKCTALSVEIKASQLPTNLKDQFHETMVQSGLEFNPQFTKDFETMMEMVGQVKASSKTGSSAQMMATEVPSAAYSTPTYATVDTAGPSVNQYSTVGYPSQQLASRSSWQHVDAPTTQAQSASAAFIPGLGFTGETSTSHSSPFELLAKQASDILGSVRAKQSSHHY